VDKLKISILKFFNFFFTFLQTNLTVSKGAPRPEWSSFCEVQRNKKAGTEGENRRPKL